MIRILRAVDSRLGGNLLFMFLMAVGAGLSLVRGFGAAVILPAAEFGLYALLVAVAAFVSSIAGFGKIEETRKLFPRMAVDGHGADIALMADRLALLVALRLTLIAVPLCFASTILLSLGWAAAIFATLVLIFGNAWCSILASALRAGPNLTQMGISTTVRAALTIIVTCIGAFQFGFSGAVFGEAFGAMIGGLLMRYYLAATVFEKKSTPSTLENHKKISIAGIYVFIGSLAIAAPIYLGRSIVAVGYSDDVLATYSFLGLLVTSIIAILGISDQMTGPKFVKSQHFSIDRNQQLGFLRKILISNMVVILISCTIFFIIIFSSYFPFFKDKYNIKYIYIIPITIYCIFQVTTTIDWFLQAINKEKRLMSAAVVQMTIFTLASLVAISANVSIVWILWIHVVAKGMQLLIQCYPLVPDPGPER